MSMKGSFGPTPPEVDIKDLVDAYSGIEPDPIKQITSKDIRTNKSKGMEIRFKGRWHISSGVIIDPRTFEPVIRFVDDAGQWQDVPYEQVKP